MAMAGKLFHGLQPVANFLQPIIWKNELISEQNCAVKYDLG